VGCIAVFGQENRRVRDTPPPSAVIFAVIGAILLVAALMLGILGSFAFIAVASVGIFFIAAALIARAVPSPDSQTAGVLGLVALGLIVFGLTATPFFYAGWGLLAGAAVLAVISAVRAKRRGASSPD
jgi:hypothetical protein